MSRLSQELAGGTAGVMARVSIAERCETVARQSLAREAEWSYGRVRFFEPSGHSPLVRLSDFAIWEAIREHSWPRTMRRAKRKHLRKVRIGSHLHVNSYRPSYSFRLSSVLTLRTPGESPSSSFDLAAASIHHEYKGPPPHHPPNAPMNHKFETKRSESGDLVSDSAGGTTKARVKKTRL